MAFYNNSQSIFAVGGGFYAVADTAGPLGQELDAGVVTAITLNAFSPGAPLDNSPDTASVRFLESGTYCVSATLSLQLQADTIVQYWLSFNDGPPIEQAGSVYALPPTGAPISIPLTAIMAFGTGDALRLFVRTSVDATVVSLAQATGTPADKLAIAAHIGFQRLGPV